MRLIEIYLNSATHHVRKIPRYYWLPKSGASCEDSYKIETNKSKDWVKINYLDGRA